MNNYDIEVSDELRMYFGDPFRVTDKIIIYQPTIGDIIDFGEEEYYSMVYTLCAIPSDMKSFLWDCGIDYMEISDFEFFCTSLSRGLTSSDTSLILGDIDLSQMILCADQERNLVLSNADGSIIIDENTYFKIVNYIRKIHGIKPKVEEAYNQYTKKILIEDDRQRKELSKNKKRESGLLGIISTLVNSPGFKYKKNELREVGYVEFMDSAQRIPMIEHTKALLTGQYSGFVDTSKIDKKYFDLMRSIGD